MHENYKYLYIYLWIYMCVCTCVDIFLQEIPMRKVDIWVTYYCDHIVLPTRHVHASQKKYYTVRKIDNMTTMWLFYNFTFYILQLERHTQTNKQTNKQTHMHACTLFVSIYLGVLTFKWSNMLGWEGQPSHNPMQSMIHWRILFKAWRKSHPVMEIDNHSLTPSIWAVE